ncbi:hypothetical protein HPB51_012693 [Rhipicephalus microplus]|uniref:Uncharacterized protein n=1 Tax=Rhipicephalus microplus TaxID=6941 RepID=A0A9J6D523_RHIMP|nr:hypothetical protein HPB51_012693 [Rhipicephalus microplus]
MLLLISGDVESNPGPQIEDMLKELLAGQQKISQDIASLTTTLDSRLKTVEARTAAAADLVPRLNKLESTVSDLKNTVEIFDHRNDNLENRLRRNNLIIYGLTETEKETPDQLLETVHELINVKLGVKCENIERWHRLGTPRNNSSPRPVIIKLIDFRTKTQILGNARKLKGSKIYINEDFSARVRQICKSLWQHSVDIRKNADKVRLRHDALIVDSVRYSWDEASGTLIKHSQHAPERPPPRAPLHSRHSRLPE